eukprot:gene23375-30636_t
MSGCDHGSSMLPPAPTHPSISDSPSSASETATSASSRFLASSVSEESPSHIYDGLTFVRHMVAGGLAGTMEHAAMYPVDTIKTRMQALSHPGQRLHSVSLWQAMNTAIRREGLKGLYKGVGAVIAGAGPAHAFHFAVFEAAKEAMGGNDDDHNPMIAGVAGAAATVVHDGIMCPIDVVKQRLQVVHSPYKGVMDCMSQVMRKDGIFAFYKAYKTTLVMNIPYQLIHFTVYDGAKLLMGPLANGRDADDTLAVQLCAGGLAGGLAAAVTTPLDLVKTRLQTEGVYSATRYGNDLLPTLRHIVKTEGQSALWHGLNARVLFHVPSAALCWGTYETAKTFLQNSSS